MVPNCMKLTHLIHRHKCLSHELRSEWVSKRASEWALGLLMHFAALDRSLTRTVSWNCMKLMRRVLGHSLVRSLFSSHRPLICLLRIARFARVLRCAHSLARLLTHSLPSSWERGFCLWDECVDFKSFQPTVLAAAAILIFTDDDNNKNDNA